MDLLAVNKDVIREMLESELSMWNRGEEIYVRYWKKDGLRELGDCGFRERKVI